MALKERLPQIQHLMTGLQIGRTISCKVQQSQYLTKKKAYEPQFYTSLLRTNACASPLKKRFMVRILYDCTRCCLVVLLSYPLGPGSYLSICSQAGVKWVSERTGSSNFRASATSLANFIARSLKLQQSSKIERVVEPDLNTAWKYTQGMIFKLPNRWASH